VTFPFGAVTTYPDGSSMSTTTSYQTVPGTHRTGSVFTTTYTDANGKVVNTTSEATYTSAAGLATTVRTDGNATQTTTTYADGSKKIVTTVRDEETKKETVASEVDLPAPAQDTRPDTDPDLPMTDAIDALGPGTGGVVDPGTAGLPEVDPMAPVPQEYR